MKRFFFCTLLLCLLIYAPLALGEQTWLCDGYTYTVLEDGAAMIVGYEGWSITPTIPSKLDSHPVTIIGECAFRYCKHLTSVTLPSGVVSIGDRAFEGCDHLQTVLLPDTLTEIGMLAFADCKALTSIVIPEGMTYIPYGMFSGCGSLSSVAISQGVSGICNYAFYDCTSLSSLFIPASVTEISPNVFDDDFDIVLSLEAGTYAETDCKDCGLAYTYVEP